MTETGPTPQFEKRGPMPIIPMELDAETGPTTCPTCGSVEAGRIPPVAFCSDPFHTEPAEVIREALENVPPGEYGPSAAKRTAALAALDRLVAERETLTFGVLALEAERERLIAGIGALVEKLDTTMAIADGKKMTSEAKATRSLARLIRDELEALTKKDP